jgi:hypothetical protein
MDFPRNRSRSSEYYRLRLNSRATFAQWVSDLISRSVVAPFLLSQHFYAIELCLRLKVCVFRPREFSLG